MLETDIDSFPVNILLVFWKSGRHLNFLFLPSETPWRRLEDTFVRYLEDVFQTPWRYVGGRKLVTLKTFSRRLGNQLMLAGLWKKIIAQWFKKYFLIYYILKLKILAVGRVISDRSVGKIKIIILSLRVGTSKNKNIDHGVKETCAIMSTQVTYEIDHISLLPRFSNIKCNKFLFFMYFIVI